VRGWLDSAVVHRGGGAGRWRRGPDGLCIPKQAERPSDDDGEDHRHEGGDDPAATMASHRGRFPSQPSEEAAPLGGRI
jgi:hypothetical protein